MMQQPRRLRANPLLRDLVQENRLHPDQLIQPLFVKEGLSEKMPIASMPGIFQWPMAQVHQEISELTGAGVKAVLLFGIPEHKDNKASQAYAPDGIIPKAIQEIKKNHPKLLVMTDVCLCSFMSHGHCGVVDVQGRINNSASVELLTLTALSHARAGADLVAPSDMMDGRVGAIRKELDAEGFADLPIMSYAVKYASNFYGPFREAAESAPQFSDRRSYQMNPANALEALREATLDVAEGADILLVKPALASLDIIKSLQEKFFLPIAAYQVSGEMAMIEAASQRGWLNRSAVIEESLLAIKRAGAQFIISYFAKEVAQKLSRS